MKEIYSNNAPEHPPPPEEMRQGNGVGAPPPGDFEPEPLTKYGLLARNSTPTAVEPATVEFTCILETPADSRPRIGVFLERHADGSEYWSVAPVPRSWKGARASRLVAPSPDGNPPEKPASLVRPFDSKNEALEVFKILTKKSLVFSA